MVVNNVSLKGQLFQRESESVERATKNGLEPQTVKEPYTTPYIPAMVKT